MDAVAAQGGNGDPNPPHRRDEREAHPVQARRDEAIAIQSQEVYDRYDKYLNGCVRLFREGYTNLGQFTLQK